MKTERFFAAVQWSALAASPDNLKVELQRGWRPWRGRSSRFGVLAPSCTDDEAKPKGELQRRRLAKCGWSSRFSVSLVIMLMSGTASSRNGLSAAEPSVTALGLVPLPTQVELKAGNWTLTRTTRLVARGVAANEAEKLAEALSVPLGWRMSVVRSKPRKGDLEMTLITPDARLGAEGYRLSVTPDRVTIRAATAAGLFYAGLTLRQLLPPSAFSTFTVTAVSVAVPEPFPGKVRRSPPQPVSWTVPCVEIMDSPRFGWRGLLVDPARHFLPFEFLKRMVDLMALHKLNTLQIHLTDDRAGA